jgi:beta-xylosidase
LAPVTWSDDWPTIQTVGGRWSPTYPYPVSKHSVSPTTGKDTFSGPSLAPAWEWNHNPDLSKFTVASGLILRTATVTTDLYSARNTLTKRIHGPSGTGTLEVDISSMADGDRAGLALLRDQSAWVGVRRDGSASQVCYVDGITMNTDWTTKATGSYGVCATISPGKIWLRLTADIAPGGTKTAKFYYSTNGTSFTQIGGSFSMNTAWQFFMGYRYGIFNHATKALGGLVNVVSFTSE